MVSAICPGIKQARRTQQNTPYKCNKPLFFQYPYKCSSPAHRNRKYAPTNAMEIRGKRRRHPKRNRDTGTSIQYTRIFNTKDRHSCTRVDSFHMMVLIHLPYFSALLKIFTYKFCILLDCMVIRVL